MEKKIEDKLSYQRIKVSFEVMLASACSFIVDGSLSYYTTCSVEQRQLNVRLYCRWFTVLRLVVAVLYYMYTT
jgi:hypothetical protein